MQKDIVKLLKIVIGLLTFLVILVVLFFLIENGVFKRSEKNKLINALKNDESFLVYDLEDDFYNITEGDYSFIYELDNSKELSYEHIDANNLSYESYDNYPGQFLIHSSYSVVDDMAEYFYLDYKTNIRYRVSYYFSSTNYSCFKNDNNNLTEVCTYEFDLFLTNARNVKKEFSNKLSSYDVSLNKLIKETKEK